MFTRRLQVVKLMLIAGFLVLIARLAYLQIYHHERYAELSGSNSIRTNFLTPIRGRIFDRNEQILATNQAAFSLEVLPDAVDDIPLLLDQVRALVELTDNEQVEFYRLLEKRAPQRGTVLLKENLTIKETAIILSHLYRLDGLSVSNFLRRVYPHGSTTSTFLGHMGRITNQDYHRIDKSRYAWNGYIGKTGLEAQYEDDMYGSPGYSYVEVDAHGRIHRELDREPAIPGKDIFVNISLPLQKKAAELMEGRRGAVVAIEPNTGELLLVYSAPSFDNNRHLTVVMDEQTDTQQQHNPLFNRALNGVYPPASTIKPFLATYPQIDDFPPDDELMCTGKLRIGRRIFHDWKRSGHGALDLTNAIAQSCDVYFYQLALGLGIDNIEYLLTEFGFGQKTGIDLPFESIGLVPSSDWKFQRYADVWRKGDTANIGIGQGYLLATPLQMAVATAVLANKGKRLSPRLLRRWDHPNQSQHHLVEPPNPRDLPARLIDQITRAQQGMNQVIHSDQGTARAQRRKFSAHNIEAAGKTGTAQVVALKNYQDDEEKDDSSNQFDDHSLFIGYAPFDAPRIALAVVVENAGNGSKVAAPIGADLMIEWITMTAPPSPDEQAQTTPAQQLSSARQED